MRRTMMKIKKNRTFTKVQNEIEQVVPKERSYQCSVFIPVSFDNSHHKFACTDITGQRHSLYLHNARAKCLC